MSSSFSQKQLSGIEQAFRKYDADGDGEVTPEELVAAMKTMQLDITLVAAKRMIQEYDTDNSGTLQLDEFKAMLEKKSKFQRAFEALDTDGSGFITKNEMEQHLKKINVDLSDTEVDEMIAEIDCDGDGKIDIKEFTNFLKFLRDQEQA